jgi:hypothetical protein
MEIRSAVLVLLHADRLTVEQAHTIFAQVFFAKPPKRIQALPLSVSSSHQQPVLTCAIKRVCSTTLLGVSFDWAVLLRVRETPIT